MNWLDVIVRDNFECIYCGGASRPLYVLTVNGDKQATSSNSAMVCRECKVSRARKIFGKPGQRAMQRMIHQRNKAEGITQGELVLPSRDEELVLAGNTRPDISYKPDEMRVLSLAMD